MTVAVEKAADLHTVTDFGAKVSGFRVTFRELVAHGGAHRQMSEGAGHLADQRASAVSALRMRADGEGGSLCSNSRWLSQPA